MVACDAISRIAKISWTRSRGGADIPNSGLKNHSLRRANIPPDLTRGLQELEVRVDVHKRILHEGLPQIQHERHFTHAS